MLARTPGTIWKRCSGLGGRKCSEPWIVPSQPLRSPSDRSIDAMPHAEEIPVVHLFTDGACSGNPGPGGWAFILRHPASGKEMERSGGESLTTNNRMELLSVIQGLLALKRRSHVDLFTDSEYVRQGLMQWMAKWKANGWKRKEIG